MKITKQQLQQIIKEEMDGNIVIVADEMAIEDNYGSLMDAFPEGEMVEDGFATGVMG